MAQALRPPPSDPAEARFQQRMMDKLNYCKEILTCIRNSETDAINGPEAEDQPNLNLQLPTVPSTVSSRTSKTSLR